MKKITLPLTDDIIESLHAGEGILLSGAILTGRDCAHKRICEFLDQGTALPFSLSVKQFIMPAPAPHQPEKRAEAAALPPVHAWILLRRDFWIWD